MFHKILTSIWRISTNVLHISTDIEQKRLQRRVSVQYHEEKLYYEVFMKVKVIQLIITDNQIKKLITVIENHYSSEFHYAN